MSNVNAEPKPSYYVLSDGQLSIVVGGATGDYFLKIEGIAGESQDTRPPTEIR